MSVAWGESTAPTPTRRPLRSPTESMPESARTTTTDVTLHGVTIPEGEKVMLVTGAATRDPRQFEEPDRFDITRPFNDYLSVFFGFGVHKCLGIHLARQEIGVVFDELLTRFPNYRVDPTRATRAILSNVRGVSSLPIALGSHA